MNASSNYTLPGALPLIGPQAVATAFQQVSEYEPFVDEQAVADFLRITPRRVIEMARKGQLPSHPIGCTRKTWRFRLSEIDAHFTGGGERSRGGLIHLPAPVARERKRLG